MTDEELKELKRQAVLVGGVYTHSILKSLINVKAIEKVAEEVGAIKEILRSTK